MKILVAPDKFKGVVTAREAAESIAAGIREGLPGANIEILPVADGGEGTAEVVCQALGGEWRRVSSHGATGAACEARYAWIARANAAVFEMSEVAGVKTIAGESFDIDAASTFGVGEIIQQAVRDRASEIIVGLGGSMTNDGGFGMARALGCTFLDTHGNPLPQRVTALTKLEHVRLDRGILQGTRIIAAADVMNPLLGPEGATRVFAAQKGARPEQMDSLEQGLTKLADVLQRDLGFDGKLIPGGGAAGGLGFGLMAFCGAEIQSGFDLVAHVIGLEHMIATADVVVTGEGSLDRQSLAGKAPIAVAAMASRLGKKVFAVVGRTDGDEALRRIFDGIFEVARDGSVDREHIRRAPELLRAGGKALAARLATLPPS